MKFVTLFTAMSGLALATASPYGRGLLVDLDGGDSFSVSRGGRMEQGTIMDRLRKEDRFRQFVKVLEKETGLRDDLDRRDTKVTLFAPTNEAMDRFEEEIRMAEREGDRPTMKEILSYHIVRDEEMKCKDMRPGMTLKTELRPNHLDRHHQRIRVVGFGGTPILNMRAGVQDCDMRAENGMIHGISNVLIPPRDLYHQIYRIPTELSTWHMALERTDMRKELERGSAWTVFAPSNEAWQRLGHQNLVHLFSCEKGMKQLKKIVEYHMAEDFAYADRIIKEDRLRMKTRHNQELEVETCRRSGGCREGRRHDLDEHRRENPNKYMFVINRGEARVEFQDIPSENGVMHLINEVLIPEDVELPSERRM
ncbi:hypothetical protein HK097_011315 [Rhizophlyctis rosea]|uniref:FAS1 domain-containing protein n=1 Tax=Rhizophlyctis rosea TaxID=64517 RepID=A0AAD5X7T1_9FUNG|nr:hypothetical protein HK097_011315 [Rhizophlyctis rosea]